MSNVVKLERKPEWLFSVDIYRDPDGKLVCVLADARTSLIESQDTPADALHQMANMIESGLVRMRDNAEMLRHDR
jgi:hypothetical protein